MKMIAQQCPNCQAPLSEDSRFCSHCGTQVVVEEETMRLKYTYQKVDDARIREADVREKIRLKELEIEYLKLQNESRQKKATLWMKVGLLSSILIVLCLLIFTMVSSNDSRVQAPCFLLSVLMIVLAAVVSVKTIKTH